MQPTGSYGNLVEGLVANRVEDLILPAAFDSRKDVLVRYVLDLGGRIVLRVVLEDDAQDFVL
jgi:hypothetical protein